MNRFSELPGAGIWKDRPQSDFEMYEEIEKIKDMGNIKYLNESDYSYQCVDTREKR